MGKKLYEHQAKSDFKQALEALLLALFFLLPFPNYASNCALLLLSAGLVFRCFQEKQLLRLTFGHWFLPVLFAYYCISSLVSGGRVRDIEPYLLLVGLPLLLSNLRTFLGSLPERRIKVAFIGGCLAAFFVCITRALVLSFSFQDGEFIFNPSLAETNRFDFLALPLRGGNRFFSVDLSFMLHPTYFSILIVIALCLIYEKLIGSSKRLAVKLISTAIVLLVALFLLSSKAAILSLGVVIVVWMLQAPISWKYKATTFCSLLCVAVLFAKFNPRMVIFFDDVRKGLSIQPDAETGHHLRVLSWDAALSLFWDHPVLGVGESKKKESMLEMYRKKGYTTPLELKLNTHNQFLDFAVGGGIFGLAFFLIGLFHLSFLALSWRNFGYVAFLTVFVFNMLFENLLSRQAGVLMFAIFVSLYINLNPKTAERG